MEWENVYVFISSTFNDMHAERDYLVRRVFPSLREWCAGRRLKLLDIDLRWGISREDAEKNKRVVEVCLHNVDRCRPFFLGFLGQRRGWVPGPDDLSPQTLERFPGLAPYIGKASVTELEILHALLHPLSGEVSPVRQSRVYVRDERYLDDIEDPEIRQLFRPEGEKDPQQKKAAEKFRSGLSQRIALQPYLADWNGSAVSPELIFSDGTDLSRGRLQNFRLPDGTSLGDDIVRWLKDAIAKEFPEHMKEEPPAEGLEAELFAQDTVRHQVCDGFLPRPEAEEAVRAYFQGDQAKPMILHAEAGAGKTSLIAHMVSSFPEGKPFYRFAGTSFDSMNTRRLLGSVLSEMMQRGVLAGNDLAFQPDMTVQMFPFLLQKASGTAERIDLVIDALDQLEDPELCSIWIPKNLPKNVRLLITVKNREDGALPEYLRELDAVLYHLGRIESREAQKRIISGTLLEYLKQLDEAQTEQLLDMKGIGNPLFLHIVLMELRQHGSFETLSAKLAADYGTTPREAFAAVLKRLCKGMKEVSPHGDEIAAIVFRLLRLTREAIPVRILAKLLQGAVTDDQGKVFAREEEAAEFCHVLFREAGPYMAASGDRIAYRYDSMRQAAQTLPALRDDPGLYDQLAITYLKCAEADQDAAEMKNAVFYALRGSEGLAWKFFTYPAVLLLAVRLLGSQAIAELMQEAGNVSLDAAALSDALIQAARRLDVCPKTIFMELKAAGNTADPLIAGILEREKEGDKWKYCEELLPDRETARILRQRDLSDYQSVFALPQGILAVGGRYMTVFDPETLKPLRTAPVKGGWWARATDQKTLFLVDRKTKMQENEIVTAGFSDDEYDLGTMTMSSPHFLSGRAAERDHRFHAWNGMLFGMAAASDDERKSWDIIICNFTRSQVLLRESVKTPEAADTDDPGEKNFYHMLLQTPPDPYFAGKYLMYRDSGRGVLVIFDLEEARPVHEMPVPPLCNIYTAFAEGELYIQISHDRKRQLLRLIREDSGFAVAGSVSHAFPTDKLQISGSWLFIFSGSTYRRFDRKTLEYGGSCHLAEAHGNKSFADGFAVSLPGGRTVLGSRAMLNLVDEQAWTAGDAADDVQDKSDDLDSEVYDAVFHKGHLYHLGRQITDIDLKTLSRTVWKRKFSPLEVFDTAHIEGDLILCYSKTANTISVLNLVTHRQVLFRKVCEAGERVLQSACLLPGATEEEMRIWLAYTRQSSRSRKRIDKADGGSYEADFYELRASLGEWKDGNLSFSKNISVPTPVLAKVFRTADAECFFAPYGKQVFFAVSGTYVSQEEMSIQIFEMTGSQQFYRLAVKWTHQNPSQSIFVTRGHIFLNFARAEQGEDGEKEQQYLADIDLATAAPEKGRLKPDYFMLPVENWIHKRPRRMISEEEVYCLTRNIYRYDPAEHRFRIFIDLKNAPANDWLEDVVRMGDISFVGCKGGIITARDAAGRILFRQRLTRETDYLHADETSGTLVTVEHGSKLGLWRLHGQTAT